MYKCMVGIFFIHVKMFQDRSRGVLFCKSKKSDLRQVREGVAPLARAERERQGGGGRAGGGCPEEPRRAPLPPRVLPREDEGGRPMKSLGRVSEITRSNNLLENLKI